jgi:hypothetical protein
MIIAERTLVLNDNGREVEVPIRIHAPENEDDGCWICRFEIGWPDGTVKRWGGGVDAVQALLIAMQMIGALLYTSDAHQSGQLLCPGSRGGYGFPVVNTIRDLLVGDDKTFL